MNTSKLHQAGTEETSVDRQRVSGQLEQWVSPTIVELDINKTASGAYQDSYEGTSTAFDS